MKSFAYPPAFDVRIQYIYYEVINSHEVIENAVHAVHADKIIDCILEKEYILKKEDIIYLLKEDGAHFFEDSLRIFHSAEKSFFQVSDDWTFEVDENDPVFSLTFWAKPTAPNFKKRFDDLFNEIRLLKGTLKNQDTLKSDVESLKTKVEMLRTSNQVLFHQLTMVYQRQPPSSSEEGSSMPSMPPRQHSDIKSGSVEPFESLQVFNSFNDYPSAAQSNKNQQQRTIDIALMYSDPLVKRDDRGFASLGDSVDYEEECNRLIELLKSNQKQLTVYFEIATMGHLVNLLSLSPTILHIICHGEFNRQKNKFYLCFEEEGKLKELYSDDLKKKLQEVDVKTKIVFVNACHSEEVAKVFKEAGVPCVIAVQSELKIEDTIALKFSENLYWQLLEGKSIGEAFKHSRIAVSEENVYTCCCAHSHKPNCAWQEYAKQHGYEKAHHLHIPTCTGCKFENKFHHKFTCEWAMKFLHDICENFDEEDDHLNACCCSPELTHNEAMKFNLICTDEHFLRQPLFQNKEKGKVTIKSNHSCVEQKFPVQKIMGRNKELYEIYRVLTDKDKRFVNLYGIEGVGKSSLAKHLANYLFERGFFRDKISIIMLEKTPSITHFRSDLFKEVPGATDWKSFCESIKLSKVLFILEKCDDLIEKSKEDFIHDLATIVKTAIHVKFVLITNKQQVLGLGETYVWMRELKKLDAAKLLFKNAYTFLSCNERNIYNLSEHAIFDLISLTPQGIWSVSEKLKNKTLDEIAKELQLEKGRGNADNSKNEKELSIKATLEEIKTWGTKTYDLVTFICLFPSGLSYQDMEELSLQGRIPSNWKSILISYLQAKKQPEKLQAADDEHTDEEKQLERSDFKPNNYIWINILKDPLTNEIYFVPTQFVSRYIENNLKEDSYRQGIKKLEYIAILSLAMIEKAKANYDYNEKLIEFSSVSYYGIWRPSQGRIFNVYSDNNQIIYLNSPAFDLSSLKKCFGYHETNLLSCVETIIVESVMKIDPAASDHLVEILETLCISIPTLSKVMYPAGDSPTSDLARRAGQLLDCLPEDPRINVIKAKLYLFLVALYLGAKTDLSRNFDLARVQLDLVTHIAGQIEDINKRQAVQAEIAFAKAIYLYRGSKKNCLKSEEIPSRYTFYKEVKDLLRNAELLVNALPDHQEYKAFKAKLTVLLCKARDRYNKKDLETKLVDDMKEAQIILKQYDAQKLLMKMHYMFACFKLDMEKKRVSSKQSNSMENTRIFTQELVKTKNIHLIKTSLDIAKRIKDKSYELKIKRKIDDINIEIRHGYFNVITLMRAAPIVDIKQHNVENSSDSRRIETEIVPAGFPTRVAASFKNDLINALGSKNKILYTKFEILTKEKLIDCLQNGCRILHINCHSVEPNYLCVEGDYAKLDRIPFEEIREIFGPRPAYMATSGAVQQTQTLHNDNKFLDVLILGIKNDRALASFFVELNIPHIITFEFTSNEVDFRHKTMEDECMTKFSILFYEQLVLQKSVQGAFDIAYENTFSYLNDTYFEGKPKNYPIKIIGEGPILLPKNNDHTEILFNDSDFPLAKGRIEDISSTRGPNNIDKLPIPYTGRNKDIHGAMKKVCEKRGFLKVTGAPGIGKTAFVMQVAYYILTRNLFPDGVFYIPVKKLLKQYRPNPSYEMKDLIKETLGLDIQSGIKNFFAGKSMLLLFDDFDLFYTREIEPPQMLFQLKDCPTVSCLLVTTSRPKAMEKKKKHFTEYRQKKLDIEGELLERNAKWKLKPMSEDELAHMLISWTKIDKKNLGAFHVQNIKEILLTKQLQGSPKNLLDCLTGGRIEVARKVIEIHPLYEKFINIEQKYLISKNMGSQSIVSLTNFMKHQISIQSDQSKISRMHSNIEARLHESPLHTLKKEGKHNSMPPDLYKANNKPPHSQDRSNVQSNKGCESERSSKSGQTKSSRHKNKKPSYCDSDDNTLLLTKSDFDPSDTPFKKGVSPNKRISEREEEEKGFADTLSEENSEYKLKLKESLEYQAVLDKLDLESNYDDEDPNDENREDEQGQNNEEYGESCEKTSPEISFAESEILNQSNKKSKNEESEKSHMTDGTKKGEKGGGDNSKKEKTGGDSKKKKNARSGRHKNRYQKNKSSKYYSFKNKDAKTKDSPDDDED